MTDIAAITDRIAEHSGALERVVTEVERVLVGQRDLVDGMLIGLLANGHVLVEGVPGLAKSLAVQSLAAAVGGVFRRIQFTPDLLPNDLLGTHVYDPRSGEWSVREGPVFANLLLADEINRAPAKVQSALLEAMQERQVSLAGETRALPRPFLVLATQNPVELEGTYPLPEAQLDRFMLKIVVDYPDKADEKTVVRRMARAEGQPTVSQVVDLDEIMAARALVDEVYVDDKALDYVVDVVAATRAPGDVGLDDLAPWIEYGGSPRASIAITQASKARAFLEGRGFVTPHDVKTVAPDVLRHRVVVTYEAEAEGITSTSLIDAVLDAVPVP